MSDDASFELSRVYAKGWTAGRDCRIDSTEDGFEAAVAALNPYQVAAERERWAKGFEDGRRRSQEMPVRTKTRKTVAARTPCAQPGE